MSLNEALVVFIVSIFVLDFNDIKFLIKNLYKIKKNFFLLQKNLLDSIFADDNFLEKEESDLFCENSEFYLNKIIQLQGYYDGSHKLNHLIKKYNELKLRKHLIQK